MLEAIFQDLFDRTTSSGLGTSTYGDATYTAPTGDDYAHVDGAKVIQTSALTSFYAGLPRVVTGGVQFDFFTTSRGTDTNVMYEVDGGWELQADGHFYHLFAQVTSNGDGTWLVAVGTHFAVFTAASNQWFTVRAEWDGTTERVRVWNRTVAEPSTWDVSAAGSTILFSGDPGISISGPSSTSRSAQLDNITIWQTFPQVVTFSDDFERSVATGLGGSWVWTSDDSYPSTGPSSSIASVDGHVAHFAAGNSAESWSNPGIGYVSAGWVRFDFLVPAAFELHAPRIGFSSAYGTYYVIWQSAGVWRAYRDDLVGAYVEFYPTAGDWWTVWFDFGHAGHDRAKAWKRAAPGSEPAWTNLPGTTSAGTPDYAVAILDVYQTQAANDVEIDNLFFWSVAAPVVQTGSFALDAVVLNRRMFFDAAIFARQTGLFDFDAIIARTFVLGAWIRIVRTFGIRAAIHALETDSFDLAGWIGATPTVFLMDAALVIYHEAGVDLKAWLQAPTRVGSWDFDAWVVGTLESFLMDAQISAPSSASGALSLDATLSDTYRHSSLSVDAAVRADVQGLFELEAAIIVSRSFGTFPLDARVTPWFTLGAYLARTFELGAEIVRPGERFSFDAFLGVRSYGWVPLDAVIANGGVSFDAVIVAPKTSVIPFIAWLRLSPSSFAVDARVADYFRLDAYVQPVFRLSAFIASDAGQRYWPPGSGGAGNPPPIDPGTGLAWAPPHHQAKIKILIDNVDVTKHVLLADCSFNQRAGSSPGTFQLPLRGAFPKYDGGEEVVVEIDDFRQFGGFITAVDHDYAFVDYAGKEGDEEHPNQVPITMLMGSDFNGLFDRVVIYNVPNVGTRTFGEYETIDPLPKGLSDAAYIKTVFSKYIDVPWRRLFDYHTYVAAVGKSPSPETPFTVETGQTLRQFMASLSQMTNAIWYLDPYYALHNHSRANANAPRAITDGTGTDSGGDPTGGIHCRNLRVSWSIETAADDVFVYGTLAETTEGEIIYARRSNDEMVAKQGLWQYAEFRSDLHLMSHVEARANILKARGGRVIHSATCEIFEKGFQAGQIVSIFSGEFDVAENIPITSLTMTFAASQGVDADGNCYGIPIYALEMSNDPEPPFNLYDALPWENFDQQYDPSVPRIQMPHIPLWNKTAGNAVGPCGGVSVWSAGCDVGYSLDYGRYKRTIGTTLIAPPPWCITLWLPGSDPEFDVSQGSLLGDTYSRSSMDVGFGQYADHSWRLAVNANAQVQGAGVLAEAVVNRADNGDMFARVQCLQDGTVRAKVWSASQSEPGGWTAVAVPPPSLLNTQPAFFGGLELASRFWFSGSQFAEYAVTGEPGWGWVWFYMFDDGGRSILIADGGYIQDLDPASSWVMTYYPAGTRPVTPHEFDPGALPGGNTIDAVAYPYPFPRPDVVVAQPGGHGDMLHQLVWDWAFVPSLGAGSPDPRMISSQQAYYGFTAPPGATRVEMTATAYIRAGSTGFLGVGNQPNPSGEGALPFEIWTSDYRGSTLVGDPNHEIIYSAVSPDFADYGYGASFGFGFSRSVKGGETIQIGGKITADWGNLMATHGMGPLLNNGLKRVIELRLIDVRLRFFWDPKPCGSSDDLGPCEDTVDPGLETGWGSEVVSADPVTGAFSSRLPLAVTTLNVYHHGRLLMPDTEWVMVGDNTQQDFRLMSPGPRCLRLVYLVTTDTIGRDPSTSRVSTPNLLADQNRMHDVRPV